MTYSVPDVVASCAGLVTAIGCAMELWTLPEQRKSTEKSSPVEITTFEGR
jgi:hypothetical protein